MAESIVVRRKVAPEWDNFNASERDVLIPAEEERLMDAFVTRITANSWIEARLLLSGVSRENLKDYKDDL